MFFALNFSVRCGEDPASAQILAPSQLNFRHDTVRRKWLKRNKNIPAVAMVKRILWGNDVDVKIPESIFPTTNDIDGIDSILAPEVEHGYFRGPSGHFIHYRKYIPRDRSVRAVCVWNHGILAHCGASLKIPSSGRLTNYALLSRSMVDNGYAFFTLDILGHGLSEGDRFFVQNWTVNRDDLDKFGRLAASQFPEGTPLFIGGESYGGCLSLHVGRLWQNAIETTNAETRESSTKSEMPPVGFRGLCLVAPAIYGDMPPAPVVFVLRYLLRPIAPKWSPFFMPNPVSPERIWSDPEVRLLKESSEHEKWGLEAPGRPFNLGTASELLSALENVRKKAIPGLKVPYCVVHGTDDGGVPIKGTFYLTKQSSKALRDNGTTVIHAINGAKHDLLAEPSAEETVNSILTWMNNRANDVGGLTETLKVLDSDKV